ncbi:MAG: HigA family addiction module antidote protein [Proteobacteria bacterium]|nr:HigA family addiction module antidote protein [Pseudomonadota bacterium]
MSMKPKVCLHPGQILLSHFVEPLGISQKKLVEHLGWTYARLNEIINMRRGITADTALAFAEVFDTKPEYWLDLQRDWDLSHAKLTHTPVKRLVLSKKGKRA